MVERVLLLKGVHNFRDFGGYAVGSGGRLRRGVLWRSGQHDGATDSDLDIIARIGLANVFDLRTSKERQIYPCRRPQGFAGEVFFSEDPVQAHAPHIAAAQTVRQHTPKSVRESLMRNYARMPFRPELQAMMRVCTVRIVEGNGPNLINCMAGKDRTGVVVAMLLLATGVHRDDVMEDYLLTNIVGDVEARIAAGAAAVRAIAGPQEDAVLRVLMAVEPEYLEIAFAAVEDQHGTIEGYLGRVLGLDSAMRKKLRAALVEE